MTQYCKNCKHLGLDGMFGLICDARGNNKNYDCPKYEEDDGDVELTDKYKATMDSGHYSYYHKYWKVEVEANDINVLRNICSALDLIRKADKSDVE